MKRHSLLAVAMSALLAAGCSSDDIVNNEGNGNNNGATGNAYISLSVQLPTTTSTRATDTFDDGAANEYAVKDMTVIVFDKNDNFECMYSTENGTMQLPIGWDKDNDNNNNITTSANTQALKVSDGEKHVVVVLNNHGMFDFSGVATLNDLKAMTNKPATGNEKSIGDFTTGNSNKGFFMASSPYYNGDTSSPKVIEYATVNPTTQVSNPGRATVFVERLTAKVSLSENLSSKVYTVANGVAAGSTAVFTNWGLDIINKSSYLFRHVNADWVSSDANRTKFTDSTNPNNRIRFAEDTNYSDNQQDNAASGSPKPVKSGLFFATNESDHESVITNGVTTSDVRYCFENTFDVDNMRQDRTTRVIFKAKYTPNGEAFNTTNNPTGSWYTVGGSTTPLNEKQFVERVNTAITAAGVTGYSPVTELLAQKLTSTDRQITTEALGFTGGNAETDAAKVRAVLGSIQVFKGGYCYYIGRIRHFNDTEAAWSNGDSSYQPSALGRYGIVRNNWYKLTVNKVSQPGSPFVPQTTTELDDVNNYYIDCDVNIEPWAVRQQGFDF